MFLHIAQIQRVGINHIASFHSCEADQGKCIVIWEENLFLGSTLPTTTVISQRAGARFSARESNPAEGILEAGQSHPQPAPPETPPPPPAFELVAAGDPRLGGEIPDANGTPVKVDDALAWQIYKVLRNGTSLKQFIAMGKTKAVFAKDRDDKYKEAQALTLKDEKATENAAAIVG